MSLSRLNFVVLQVQLVGLDEESSEFICRNTFDHPYPTTKLMWIPDTKGVYPDLLATSGDYLRVWRVSRCCFSCYQQHGVTENRLGLEAAECHCHGGETNARGSEMTLFDSADFLVDLAKIPGSPCCWPQPALEIQGSANLIEPLRGWRYLRPLILFTVKILLSKLNRLPGH